MFLFALFPFVFGLGAAVLVIAGLWQVYVKAGRPGWAAIVPFYNAYVLLKIAGRPGWWLLFVLVPLANIVIAFIVAIDIAKAFGKGAAFGCGLAVLAFIFYPILGFGAATYRAPVRA
jgi:Family of unknown function (DUF5684)